MTPKVTAWRPSLGIVNGGVNMVQEEQKVRTLGTLVCERHQVVSVKSRVRWRMAEAGEKFGYSGQCRPRLSRPPIGLEVNRWLRGSGKPPAPRYCVRLRAECLLFHHYLQLTIQQSHPTVASNPY